ncbi:MAG: MazE family transcriptional regulator [Desulfobacteraceae bacterium IS3]|jgi:antitoxin MazE|nr:MAG: MazE family transcriptional regulator [Desulfobacteraceae bacterium IS3]HAO20477.1 AbrB/MazE/SpoVT family DNA-binding domain-containing protein [Desulfobacteraceae bacterium]
MKTQIVKIGNSHGVRIPKIFLKETDIGTDVEMEVRNRQIIIRPAKYPRQGWEEAFCKMRANEDDILPDDLMNQTCWDEEEWEW